MRPAEGAAPLLLQLCGRDAPPAVSPPRLLHPADLLAICGSNIAMMRTFPRARWAALGLHPGPHLPQRWVAASAAPVRRGRGLRAGPALRGRRRRHQSPLHRLAGRGRPLPAGRRRAGGLTARSLRRAADQGLLPRVPAADGGYRGRSGARAVGVGLGGRTGGNVIAPGDEVLSIDGAEHAGLVGRAAGRGASRGRPARPSPWWSGREARRSPVVRRFTRTEIHVPAASRGVLLADGVGYIVLRRMSQGAAEELRAGGRHAGGRRA